MASANGSHNPVHVEFQDLPKPWLVSLISWKFTDKSTRMALFGTCRVLSQLVVENCTVLHIQPAVAELRHRPVNCAALSRLAMGCKWIHLELQGGSIPITADVARNVKVLTLIDTHLNSETIHHLCMDQMDKMFRLKLSYNDGNHRHSAGLDEDALSAAWSKCPRATCFPHSRSDLCIQSADADDVYTTLRRLRGALRDSLEVLHISQVSALKAIYLYPRLTVLFIENTAHDQLMTEAEQVHLITHATLKCVFMPGSVWPTDVPDYSNDVWPLTELQLTSFGGHRDTLARLPLQGVKRLTVEGGFDGTYEMYEEMLVNLRRCEEVVFQPAENCNIHTDHGVPEDVPVLQVDNCLDSEVMTYVTQYCTASCLWLTMCQWLMQLHYLDEFAHISAHVTTLALASWKPCREDGCTWVEIWRRLPVHVSHVVLAQVYITKDEMLAIFEEPLRPALQQVTLAYRPGSKSTGWVPDAADEVMAMASSKWGNSVRLNLKMVLKPFEWDDYDDLPGSEGVSEDDDLGPEDAPLAGDDLGPEDAPLAGDDLGPEDAPLAGPAVQPEPQHGPVVDVLGQPALGHVPGAAVGPVAGHGGALQADPGTFNERLLQAAEEAGADDGHLAAVMATLGISPDDVVHL